MTPPPFGSGLTAVTIVTLALLTSLSVSGACGSSGGHGGASTTGGALDSAGVVRVTNLDAAGEGSLAAALAGGDRRIVFDVGGEIRLRDEIAVGGARVTIDGTTAPAPGITLRGGGLRLSGADVHDVVIRGIRVRDPEGDGIQVAQGAHHVRIENVSVDGCGDGNIDVTHGAHEVSVTRSVLSGCSKNVLIKYGARGVSFHYNAFLRSQYRNPWVAIDNEGSRGDGTTADLRSNLVWDWGNGGGGTGIECGARVNLVGNYYASPRASPAARAKAVIVRGGCAPDARPAIFASGNVSGDASLHLDGAGTESRPLAGGGGESPSACEAAREVLATAGARPLDALDSANLSAVSLPGCSPGRSR